MYVLCRSAFAAYANPPNGEFFPEEEPSNLALRHAPFDAAAEQRSGGMEERENLFRLLIKFPQIPSAKRGRKESTEGGKNTLFRCQCVAKTNKVG